MNTSITRRYASTMLAAQSTAPVWTWPSPSAESPTAPDSRLLSGEIAGLTARLNLGTAGVVETRVRAVSQHDLVLMVNDLDRIPVCGQVVGITICLKGDVLFAEIPGILHFAGVAQGTAIVGLFTVEPMGAIVRQWQGSGQRGEIRYPIDVPAAIGDDDEPTFGRIIDYSLSGCRFHCVDEIELSQEYDTTVLFPHSTIELNLTPRWVLNNADGFHLGCTFRPEQGVLMACRHHAQPNDLSFPLLPKTSDWSA